MERRSTKTTSLSVDIANIAGSERKQFSHTTIKLHHLLKSKNIAKTNR